MTAPELLRAYLARIQDPTAAAALFADDGVIELPTINRRAQGPAAIEQFIAGLRPIRRSASTKSRRWFPQRESSTSTRTQGDSWRNTER
jgi:hypothetical protein